MMCLPRLCASWPGFITCGLEAHFFGGMIIINCNPGIVVGETIVVEENP